MVETIALFGASGMTGKQLVPLALEQGYKIKALVRTPSKVQTKHENLTIIQGDFSNTEAIQETVAGADYVICCAGGAFKPKEYTKDLMLNFVSTLLPILESDSSSVKVFVYQAGAFSKTPDGKLPFMIKVMRPIIGKLMGIGPNLLDNDAVIRYLDKNKPSSFQVIVTRPGQIVDKDDDKMKLVASDKPEMKSVTFKALAAFTLQTIQDESLYGKYPYCAIVKA
jgi:nucleoside-diphosphate-sugar epimerase